MIELNELCILFIIVVALIGDFYGKRLWKDFKCVGWKKVKA